MKINKLTFMAVVTLGALTAFAPLSQAQEKDAKPATPPPAGNRGGGRGGITAEQVEKAAADLKLEGEKKDKFIAAFKEQREKMAELRADTNLSQEDRTAKMRELRDNLNKKVLALLNDDQKKQWEELSKTLMPARGGRRQAPPQ